LLYGLMVLRTCFIFDGKVWFTLVDDAMISMRYSEHLADGYGLVWNKGEAPVEGYSNTLWTLLMTVAHLLPLGKNLVPLIIILCSMTLLLANLIYIDKTLVLLGVNEKLRFLAVLLSGLNFPVLFWSLRGLETGAEIFLITAAAYYTLRFSKARDVKSCMAISCFLVLLFLIRVDAIKELPVFFLWFAWIFISGRISARKAAIRIFVLVFPLLAVITAFYILRYLYFGDTLPNTYYLKVSGTSLPEKIFRGFTVLLFHNSDDTAIYLATLPALYFVRKQLPGSWPFYFLFFMVQIAYSVYVGGDYVDEQIYGGNRFVTVGSQYLVILFILLVSRVLRSVRQPVKYSMVAMAAMVIVVVQYKEAYGLYFQKNFPLLRSDITRMKIGLLLKEHAGEEVILGVHAAGNIPYYSEARCIDLLGKSDKHIALTMPKTTFRPGHNKWDYHYSILGRRPDIIADDWGEMAAFMDESGAPYARFGKVMWVRKDFLEKWRNRETIEAILMRERFVPD